MPRSYAAWIHLTHVALLLIAALDDAQRDSRPRRQAARPAPDPFTIRPPSDPRARHDGRTSGRLAPSAEAAPRCPMPVWQPDPNVRYAVRVIGLERADGTARRPETPCVNPYARFAAGP